jgi:hypothetical protein
VERSGHYSNLSTPLVDKHLVQRLMAALSNPQLEERLHGFAV